MILTAMGVIGALWCCVHQRRKAARSAQARAEGTIDGGVASVGLNGTLVDPHR